MLCTVIGIGRYTDKDRVEKCALYVGYDRKEVSGMATRALMLDSNLVDVSVRPQDVVEINIDFNGNIDSVSLVK